MQRVFCVYGGFMRRAYSNIIKGINQDAGTVDAVVSSETPDREGDIIRVAGWDFNNFLKHPVLLADHNYKDINAQIGEWSDVRVVKTRRTVEGTASYFINSGNQTADWAFELAKRNQAAYSVGFIPDMEMAKVRTEGSDTYGPYEFHGQELLEVSAVTIPANAEALQRMKALDLHPMVMEMVDTALHMDADGPTDIQKSIDDLTSKMDNLIAFMDQAETLEAANTITPIAFYKDDIQRAIRRGVYRAIKNMGGK
jgi:hypothetical protein